MVRVTKVRTMKLLLSFVRIFLLIQDSVSGLQCVGTSKVLLADVHVDDARLGEDDDEFSLSNSGLIIKGTGSDEALGFTWNVR